MRAAAVMVLTLAGAALAAGDVPAFSPAVASKFAGLALACAEREYPNKLDHTMAGPAEVAGPRALHPAFYGCFDWHSSVHGHWLMVRALRRHPDLPEAAALRRVLGAHLAPDALATELAYFRTPGHRGFERPYGWAWLLKLSAELRTWDDPDARRWHAALEPLAQEVARAFAGFLPKLTYPNRVGTHANTAYALTLALDYAEAAPDPALAALIRVRARTWFQADRQAPLAWEPGGEDFLSPALEEAALMARVLPAATFRTWLPGFLPGLLSGQPLKPAVVSDRSDPRIVHLDGLNLSRAYTLRTIAGALPGSDPRRARLDAVARAHALASLPHIATGSYEGEHWLATFATRLLSE